MLVRAHVLVTGRVQGVLYRWTLVRMARPAGVRGWVKNLHDGRVEAVLEGEEENIKRIIDWMRVGPERAVVEDTEVTWNPYVGEFSDFRIMR